MKAVKPKSDQECSFTVSANGIECPEYVLPNTTITSGNVLECFIPVSIGDQLTLKGRFDGTVLHGAFDLVADGTFVGDKRIEGRSGQAKFAKVRFTFTLYDGDVLMF